MVSVADRLGGTFGARADPTRRAILARLAKGEASVTELAEPFEMSLPAVSKHLKVLERAGLVSRGRGREGGPARRRATPIKEVAEWTDRYRRFWDERYDRLDEYLDELRGRGPSKRKEEGDGRERKVQAHDGDAGSEDRHDGGFGAAGGVGV